MSEPTADGQLRALVENLDVAVVLRETDPLRYVYVSSAFERIFGWPAERLLDDPTFLLEVTHPEDRERATVRLIDQIEGPIPDIEWRIVRRDGAQRWLRAKCTVLARNPGEPQQIAGFIEDVTDRRTAEADLARSRDWFDTIASTVPIGFAIRDPETLGYEYVSPAYQQIFARDPQDFYDDPATAIRMIHPDDSRTVADSRDAAASGEPWSYESRIVRPSGEVRWLRGHQVSTVDRGSGRWIANTIEDVTEQKAREEQLRTLVEANIVGVGVANGALVTDANDRYLEITGYTRADLESGGISWDDLYLPEWGDITRANLEQVRETGSCPPYEKEYKRKDGSRVPVLVGNAMISQEPLIFTSVVLDLTEVKQKEVALRYAQAEAQRANDEKSAFLSRMSHELRTPLNAVIGFGQLLSIDELTRDQQESVDQIVKGGRHLLALINEVLDISRIESGSLQLSLEPVHLAEVVDEALALVRHLGDARHVTIEDRCPPTCSEFVRADRQRLRQVVLNLLANAIKYNRDEGAVMIQCERASDSRIRLVVTDTGIGITESAMSRLFSPFDRLGAEHTDVEGTGLGLTLTKRLVEAMGGDIGAVSVAGQGSTFWVELDQAGGPAAVQPGETDDQVRPSEVLTPPGRTVLYIEDNQANVRLVQRILALREGVSALVAMQASLGLDLARTHRPNLILLDLNLPDMPGVEALRRLRADHETADIPVVIVSADATPGQIHRLRAEGAVDYLAKPFEIEQLLALVDEHATDRHQ